MSNDSLVKIIKRLLPESASSFEAVIYNRFQAKILKDFYRATAREICMESGTILDIGTGCGYLPIEIIRYNPHLKVIGIDLSKKMISIARRNAKGYPNIEFYVMDGKQLKLDSNFVDFIISTGSLHHWKIPIKVLNEMHRVLKFGRFAWIIDCIPNSLNYEIRNKIHNRFLLFLLSNFVKFHGFTEDEYYTLIKDIIEESRFKKCRFEKCRFSMKIIIEKSNQLESIEESNSIDEEPKTQCLREKLMLPEQPAL